MCQDLSWKYREKTINFLFSKGLLSNEKKKLTNIQTIMIEVDWKTFFFFFNFFNQLNMMRKNLAESFPKEYTIRS